VSIEGNILPCQKCGSQPIYNAVSGVMECPNKGDHLMQRELRRDKERRAKAILAWNDRGRKEP
jgi:hypothetical protein